MIKYNSMSDLKLTENNSDLYPTRPVILPPILMTISVYNMIAWKKNKSSSQWPIFHGPLVLLLIL